MNTVPEALPDSPALTVEGLQAYYQTRCSASPARCGRSTASSFEVERDEIYGIAGEVLVPAKPR